MDFIRKHKTKLVVIVSLICVITMIITAGYKLYPTYVGNAIGFVTAPVQEFFTGIGNWFGDRIADSNNITELRSENERLSEELEALRIENTQLKNISEDYDKLAELLEIDNKYEEYPKTGAMIISKDPGNWYNTFLINRGTKDGIESDMVVMAGGGLVGYISETGYNYARVTALIDDTSSISAICARTGDTGYVRGDTSFTDSGLCKMEFISADSEMVVGDEITTSHLSSRYPSGLIIGYVTEIHNDAIGTKYAIIEPTVDFSNLETVLVITELFDNRLIDSAESE